MSKLTKILIATVFTLLLAAPGAQAQRFGGPRVFVGVGPAYYGYGYGYSPYYYPGYGYAPRANTGEVKIDTKIKDGAIYVDNGFAGATQKLKKFWLTIGNHDIEVRDSTGHPVFKERVQVLADQTVNIKPTN